MQSVYDTFDPVIEFDILGSETRTDGNTLLELNEIGPDIDIDITFENTTKEESGSYGVLLAENEKMGYTVVDSSEQYGVVDDSTLGGLHKDAREDNENIKGDDKLGKKLSNKAPKNSKWESLKRQTFKNSMKKLDMNLEMIMQGLEGNESSD